MTPLPTIRGFRSGIINALSARVREQRPVAGPGLIVTPGPGGTAISLARTSPASALSLFAPWAPAIVKDPVTSISTITFSNPIFLRSPKYVVPAEPTFDLTANDGSGDYYCGVKISVLTDVIDSTLLLDKTLANVVYTSLADANADANNMRLLVCILTYDSGTTAWTLKLRCIASVPELGLYV
jgi:hypothetical protein